MSILSKPKAASSSHHLHSEFRNINFLLGLVTTINDSKDAPNPPIRQSVINRGINRPHSHGLVIHAATTILVLDDEVLAGMSYGDEGSGLLVVTEDDRDRVVSSSETDPTISNPDQGRDKNCNSTLGRCVLVPAGHNFWHEILVNGGWYTLTLPR